MKINRTNLFVLIFSIFRLVNSSITYLNQSIIQKNNLIQYKIGENDFFSSLFFVSIFRKVSEYIHSKNIFQRELSLAAFGYFCYFLIHNLVDCPWTAYGHGVPLLTLVFVMFFLNKIDLLKNEK